MVSCSLVAGNAQVFRQVRPTSGDANYAIGRRMYFDFTQTPADIHKQTKHTYVFTGSTLNTDANKDEATPISLNTHVKSPITLASLRFRLDGFAPSNLPIL